LDVYNNYPFKSGFLDTFISVTVSSLIVYFSFKIVGLFVSFIYTIIPAIRYLFAGFGYVPSVFFIALFVLLFDYSYTAEVVFLVLVLAGKYCRQIFQTLDSLPQDLLNSYKTMHNRLDVIMRRVLWRHSLIDIKKKMPEYYVSLWGYAIVYEILGDSVGLGKIILYLINFKDYLGLLAVIIFVGLALFICERILRYAVFNSTFWE